MVSRRVGFFALVTGTTALGAGLMFRIVAAGGFTLLEAGILVLFTVTFGWIVVPFWTAVVGFVLQILGRDARSLRRLPDEPQLPLHRLRGRTALVMPVYGEDPEQVEARLSAMARSLVETGHADRFDIHLLSDTRDGACARREEAAWARLQGTHPEMAFFYRRRAENRGRKAGNIAEFCRRCADDYDFMVVLDADSLMSGSTLVRLAARMEADPSLGLIQTVPLPIRQETAFGRLVQFAGCLYGPLLATGQSFWQGDTANYWGHNAIVRLRPFADHAVLPVLPGGPPLGGEILSHDFVEAAWLRRAGWRVVLDASAGGSFEEVPATVPDYIARDRRWAQGSLQHLRLLFEPGLAFTSRLHFALGAMGYLSSFLWLLFLLAGTAYVLIPGAGGWSLDLRAPSPPDRVSLLAATAVVLFLPKVLGLVLALVDRRRRGSGRVALVASVVVETLFSVLLAPIMMLAHTRFVLAICAGRSVGWEPQPRDGDTLPWSAAFRAAAPATAIGLVWGGSTLALSPGFFVWMSPIFAGLLLATPLIRWSGSDRLGALARRAGLLATPFEQAPPAEVRFALEATASTDVTDPRHRNGVPPIMHNAERGLFDLRRGRPLLVRPGHGATGVVGTPALVAAVEGLTSSELARLRRLTASEPRLVVTRHRATAMGFECETPARAYSLALENGVDAPEIVRLAAEPMGPPRLHLDGSVSPLRPAGAPEAAGLALAHLGRMLPAVLAFPVSPRPSAELAVALESGAVLAVDASEALAFVEAAGAEVRRVSEAPVPLSQAEHTRFILFRETYGLGEHVAILVGSPHEWPDPVPVRLHSACLTGDLFGSLRCDCGEQLRGSLDVFEAMGGGVLLYLAQEGRGIGLGNKFRAYTLQEGGLDTIDADSTLGFGADERNYDIAARILHEIGVERIELLTNNPEKVQAMEDAGIAVARRRPLHGRLNRHNLPYVRAKVQRAGHWLGDMLSQPITGD